MSLVNQILEKYVAAVHAKLPVHRVLLFFLFFYFSVVKNEISCAADHLAFLNVRLSNLQLWISWFASTAKVSDLAIAALCTVASCLFPIVLIRSLLFILERSKGTRTRVEEALSKVEVRAMSPSDRIDELELKKEALKNYESVVRKRSFGSEIAFGLATIILLFFCLGWKKMPIVIFLLSVSVCMVWRSVKFFLSHYLPLLSYTEKVRGLPFAR